MKKNIHWENWELNQVSLTTCWKFYHCECINQSSYASTTACTAGRKRADDQNVTSDCVACDEGTWGGSLNNDGNCTQCHSNSGTFSDGRTSPTDCGMCLKPQITQADINGLHLFWGQLDARNIAVFTSVFCHTLRTMLNIVYVCL